MSHPEHPSDHRPEHDEPLAPNVLPPELAEFLRREEVTCLMHATNHGTVFVIKLPGREIESMRGPMPILITHELYACSSAPVIRTVLHIYDQPEAPFALEMFTNIRDQDQQEHFAALAQQEQIPMLFYDEALRNQLAKVVPQSQPELTAHVLTTAEELLAGIPPEQFDFERAKQEVMEATGL